MVACGREALPEVCPVVDVGELVISELRGNQAEADTFGHYVEIYNAAGKTVNLEGLRLRLREAGGDELSVLVRDPIELPAGGYAVIAPGGDEIENSLPNWADYGVGWDISGGNPTPDPDDPNDVLRYPDDLLRYGSAFVELEGCGGELIDVMFYGDAGLGSRELPGAGTLACGNATTAPNASDNDNANAGCWCVDDQDAGDQPLFGIGLPGSPGAANRCE